MQQPLLVGFPVPPGADSAHLALGVLSPLNGQSDEQVWDFLDGLYDADQGLFLTTLPFLHAKGDTFVLAEAPDFDSPPNGARLQAAGTRVGAFTVSCRVFYTPECIPETEKEVAQDLDLIYQRMTKAFHFTDLPRLRSPFSHIVLKGEPPSLAGVQGYETYIVPQTYRRCEHAAGLYRQDTGILYLCYSAAQGILPQILIHEYFHSVQFAYPNVLNSNTEDRIIEGTAKVAEDSYFLDGDMSRTDNGGWEKLHTVDSTLNAGVSTDGTFEEYDAQDFWAYVGQRFQRGLDYLEPILEEGGATTDGIAAALKSEFGLSFGDIYWGWVKNQVIEKVYKLGGGLGDPCKLEQGALYQRSVAGPVEL